MKWISVDDKLPDYEENVLIARNNKHGDNCKSTVVFGYRKLTDITGDIWMIETNSVAHGCITHWMPLPSPPEEI